MRFRSKASVLVAAATAAYLALGAFVALRAQEDLRGLQPYDDRVIRVGQTSFKSLVVQDPPNLADFVADRAAAIRLGKALFWEQQASSDGSLACASCHFHAGADNRLKNQVAPGGSNVFDPMASGNKGGPNYTHTAADYPYHRLSNPDDRESNVVYDTDDIAGSSGVFNSDFTASLGPVEKQTYYPDGVFQVGNLQTRRVTGRNAPTVINAALNFRNFWDGRANFVFNGVTPFGPRDNDARIWVDDWYTDPNTGAQTERAVKAVVRVPFASLASQAVGPALSAFEMSGASRQFADLGHKLLSTRPLLNQSVSSTDSVLGKYRNVLGFGLSIGNYETMIKAAFQPEYWQVPDATFKASSGLQYRQVEANFSLFWGLAIQLYESTLISDDSRYDRYVAGDKTQLTAQEQLGLAIFTSDKGKCVNCHKGAEFTGASTRMVLGTQPDGFSGDGPVENMLMGDQDSAIYDNGFYNIGVSPTKRDVGIGGTDPWGNPLSFSRSFKNLLGGSRADDAFTHSLDPCLWMLADGCTIVRNPRMRDAVDGSFKTPTLRNIELTGPYFHNGGYATLEQVVEFYNRGGNMRRTATGDTTEYGDNHSNFAAEVMPLGLSATEKAALVAFLKTLTDDRVRYEKAPFDHPSLRIPHGHKGDNTAVQSTDGVKALDEFISLPAVGAAGATTPIKPYLQ